MKKLYLLHTPYLKTEERNLFMKFITENRTNESFINTFDTIIDHITKFQIVDNEIDDLYWDESHNTLIYSMDVSDLLGRIRRNIVIKKLRKFQHTYEIRINQEYYKHRILFQFNSLKPDEIIKEEFFILSYGFSKIETGTDLTDSLSNSNDFIKNDIIDRGNLEESFNLWLGGDWIEY